MNTNITTTDRKTIFTLAWEFVRKCGYTMSEALTTAWRNIKLRKAMTNKVVEFWYKKATTGELRQAFGTTDTRRYHYEAVGGRDYKPADCVRYWDTVKGGFRMFKNYNLIKVCL